MAAAEYVDRNRRVGLIALFGALSMLALAFASVPLYRIFCQVTGFGGTTQRVSEADAQAVVTTDRMISVRFDANVDRGMPWMFRAGQVTQDVPLGGRRLAIFRARNDSDQPITGMASFNVTPVQAGQYFSKVQCFCFNEQTLQPGQEVSMPVIFYVDPKIADDPNTVNIEQVTLSYTFHHYKKGGLKALDPAGTDG